jgi:hypothetical protein
MGLASLAVDVGSFWTARRNMQTAADGAALSGAIALRLKQNITKAAQSVAGLNGFTDGTSGVSVTVNNPPASGADAGDAKFVEVIVSQPRSPYFLRALGYSTVTVSARAVGSSVNSPACVYALDPTASGALSVSGSSSMTLQCGAYVDSSSTTGLTTGGGGTLTAGEIGVVGGYSGSGFTPTPKTGIAPAPDPLSYVPAPTVGSCDHNNYHAPGNSAVTLSPGVYCGGIQISGSNNVTFNPGMYILNGGGFKVTGSATLTGSGVTFYNTQSSGKTYDGIAIGGTATVNLTAPTSGTYEGMLFFQDRSVASTASSSLITGSSTSTYDGAIYFSTTTVSYAGNSSNSGYTILVGDKVTVNGNSQFGANYSSLADGSPIKTTALYE